MRPCTRSAVQRTPEHNTSVAQELAAGWMSRGGVCGKCLRGPGAISPEHGDSEQRGCHFSLPWGCGKVLAQLEGQTQSQPMEQPS